VAVETSQITPAITGIILELPVVDTQQVKQGDVLAVIDPTDAKLELARAAAELQRAQRQVRGFLANDEGYAAQLAARGAGLEYGRLNLKRCKELSNARTADTTVDTNPEVALARAAYARAQVDLQRTVLRAPVDGVIAKRMVQVGQRVQAGAALMSVVPLEQVHVDVNFKEVQLKGVAVGQAVELKSDLYGGSVVYHGTVTGFAGGTGSAFALIPSQNATGNWLKVVQRLPVRVQLDPKELRAHPLQVGLSMTATIDTSQRPASQRLAGLSASEE
jgi:membrane fusion protein (multidrug efflux system)